jgi:hypothetical protein
MSTLVGFPSTNQRGNDGVGARDEFNHVKVSSSVERAENIVVLSLIY